MNTVALGKFCFFMKCSLRSKRFQSSYCAKVGAEAKKKLPSFLDEPREETLATQAI